MSCQQSIDTTSPGQSGAAWSSGRRLTLDQRERKREKNRKSRRDAYQRENARIAAMKAELQSLKGGPVQSTPQDESTTVADLSLEALAFSKKYESSTVMRSVPTLDAPFSLPTYAGPSSTSQYRTAVRSTCPNPTQDVATFVRSSPLTRELSNPVSFPLPVQSERIQALAGPEPHPLLCTTSIRRTTEFTNDIFTQAKRLESPQVCTDAFRNEDVLAKATLYGWDIAFQNWKPPCALWLLLRSIDTVLLAACHGPMERMTILRAVHTMALAVIINSTASRENLPYWYRPRPAQTLISHDLVTDFIVWPGMRERIVLHGSANILTNEFWMAFFKSFRFYWPGEFQDAFDFNPQNGQHTFTGELRNRLSDINHWRMDMSFFNKFPAFVDDILPFQAVPQYITLWSDKIIGRAVNAAQNERWNTENSRISDDDKYCDKISNIKRRSS